MLAAALAPSAAAMPAPYPSYFNRSAPTLGDGVHGAAPGTGQGAPGTAPSSSRCNAAKRSVTRAKRKIRSLKRKLRRARARSRKRVLKRSIRSWNRRLRGRRRAMRRRCGSTARVGSNGSRNRPGTFPRRGSPPARAKAATTAGGAYFRAGVISCEPGYMHMYAGPDMRSQSPNFVQGVAFRVAIFRWNGSTWVYDNEFSDYWWGTAGFTSPPPIYYDSADEWRFNDQGFFINVPGTYRFAVRYHWWPSTAGARQDSSWNWAGVHQSNGVVQNSCQYT